MPISKETIAALEDSYNRLATETIFAQVGRDDGLIPAYSLLGELIEQAAGEPTLQSALTAVRAGLDKLLDEAKPFDEPCLKRLRKLADWMPLALTALRKGETVPSFVDDTMSAVTTPAVVVVVEVDSEPEVDVVLDLLLEENRELLVEFHAEAIDHLDQIEAALLQLEQEPDHPDALNSIFRSFHTIKGVSGFLHLVPMHKLTHEVESLLDLVRTRKLRINSPIITEILKSRDAVKAMISQITVALEHGRLPSEVVPVSHLIRAVKRLASGKSESVVETAPVVVEGDVVEPVVTRADAPAVSVPVADKSAAGQTSTKSSASNESGSAGKGGSSATVRVNTDKLDTLMNVVGELVIIQSQLNENARGASGENTALQRTVGQLARITKELQHTAMALRMIPIKPTFQKMERLARDLSRDCAKKVQFLVSGEDTELDRTVVEEIGDPLVHMVRNSMDHGLEKPSDRVAAGKPEHGTVHLKAYHQGSNIVIELSDDGRGIDTERVLKKAREKGLVAPNVELTKDEMLQLIFLPGFSTAEKITAVSGRGVGMDVVKRNIEKLRGKIEISSEIGKGSTFKIKLPLTMAIIDGLVVRVGEDRFILPSTSVKMALRPTSESLCTVQGTGEVVDLRGKILPIHRLHRRFDIPHAVENPTEGILVLVEANGKTYALLVDEMVSKQEVVIKSLGDYMQGLTGVAGGAILGDGNIALILDPTSLFQAA